MIVVIGIPALVRMGDDVQAVMMMVMLVSGLGHERMQTISEE